MPSLEAWVRQLIAAADGHLDHLSQTFHQVDVEIAAQLVAYNLSTQLHRNRRQHACHPDGHVGIIAIGYFNFIGSDEQCGVTILIRNDALEFHVTYAHGTVFALQNKILQSDVIQSVVLNDRKISCLL